MLVDWCGVITLFRPISVLCGIDNIFQNILHIQLECEECFTEYCQSHRTLVWIWIMLWSSNRVVPCFYICIHIPHYYEIHLLWLLCWWMGDETKLWFFFVSSFLGFCPEVICLDERGSLFTRQLVAHLGVDGVVTNTPPKTYSLQPRTNMYLILRMSTTTYLPP